jgi:hypothetical protein
MKTQDRKKNKKDIQPKIRIVHVLDILIFLLIIISLSIGLMVLGIEVDPSEDEIDYSDEFFSENYVEDLNEVLLTSTISRVSYIDLNDNETVYIGYSINQLILEDAYLRINSDDSFNLTGLELGLQSRIQELARDLIDIQYAFRITVTSSNIDLFIITSIDEFSPDPNVTSATSVSLLSSDLHEELVVKLELFKI